ncbi:hypothetical protein BT93_E1543 [Corymbia citriodora subsp. variegata]|nr:hypothetical protein BT93_E1543 [Corymbia citriodora subsp. variegata]
MGVQGSLWMVVTVSWLCLQAQLLHSQEDLVCNSSDFKALLDLMSNFESPVDGWGLKASANCCDWPGVSGGVGFARKKLVGNLSDSIGKLDQLRFLNLSHDLLARTLPESLFHLPNLQVLDLSYNEFSGPVPKSANLPLLCVFNIYKNFFSGSLPVRICANSTRIQVLNLAVNCFSDVILPGLGNRSSLQNPSLATNSLTGVISEDIFTLGQLVQLSLQENSFSGPLNHGIGNLTELVRLDISTNGFSGSIPNMFQNMKKRQYFIGQSNGFRGSIPSSLSNLPSLKFLNLNNNSLTGTIVLNCSAMSSLLSLDLGSNSFRGPFPEDLPNCQKLQNVNLARNKFTTPIPQSFKNFSSLAYLLISNSSLSNILSALGILQHCSNLTVLVLTLNYFDEELPSDASLSFPKLKFLDLSWNRLGGTILSWIGDFQSFFYLDLSNNSFVGEIPEEITRLPSLIQGIMSMVEPFREFPLFMKRDVSVRRPQYNQVTSFPRTVDLGWNSLNGSIWPEFGDLKNVHILDLRNNFISGSIPDSLSGMTSLETLDLSYNNLSGSIPSSLVRLNFLSKFSVAYNNLSGPAPGGGQFPTFPNSSFEGNLCGDHTSACPASQSHSGSPAHSQYHSRSTDHDINEHLGVTIGLAFGMAIEIALGTTRASDSYLRVTIKSCTRVKSETARNSAILHGRLQKMPVLRSELFIVRVGIQLERGLLLHIPSS